jgi:DNA-binding transcriptional MerR regulator
MAEQLDFTIGEIADRLEEPPARVAYVISKYRLKPVRRVGIIRLFSEDQIQAIRESLLNIQIHTSRGVRPCA